MTVVSRSETWGENRAPRIIRPSRYMIVTDPAISAPRPGRLSSRCPAPGISHANTMAESQFEDEGTAGADCVGVTGKLAPGLSLTRSFYRILGHPFNALRARAPHSDPYAHIGTPGSWHL